MSPAGEKRGKRGEKPAEIAGKHPLAHGPKTRFAFGGPGPILPADCLAAQAAPTTRKTSPVTNTNAAQGAPQNEAPPMFYTRIEALVPTAHKDFKIRPETEFGFAGKTNTVPLTVPEFSLAARHYPIMLLGEDLVPTAALGFNPEQNLYVDANNKWENGVYVPAYVRRHPFILLGGGTDERLTLGIDAAANSSVEGARPLFNADGKETEAVTQALDFCDQFHNAYLFTREFSAALKKANIVDDRSLEVELSPGKRSMIGSFKRIDEEKFKALPDSLILEWRKLGFLHAIYFQLQSMNNWDMLLARNGMLTAAQG